MIRDKFYKDIVDRIDSHSKFESSDFKIDAKGKNQYGVTLEITYKLDLRYKMIFQVPSSITKDKSGYHDHYEFTGTVCPGPIGFDEKVNFHGEDEVFSGINTWLNCIWEELSSNPAVRQIENQEKQIDIIFSKFTNLKDEYFTIDEAEDIKTKLDNLEKEFKENLEKEVADKKELELKTASLEKDIAMLKVTVESLKKAGWLKSFVSKAYKWSKNSDNRKLLKDGYEFVRQILPEDYKNMLPEINKVH